MNPSQRLFDAIGAQLVLHREFGDVAPRVGDEYEIVEILGAGGFGLICRATKLALQRQVALKLFPLGSGHDDQGPDLSGVREALREARSLARLEHPGIVGVFAAGETEVIAGDRLACAYVEMQLIDGVHLREWLLEPREAGEVLALLIAAGRALAHAHAAGIVHRDFKPENLMVDRSGRAKVIDFGLALVAEASERDGPLARWHADSDAIGTRATGTGLIRGTPGYMAPEASQGRPRAASDQFALAVVIREALTGRHPFELDASGSAPSGGPELFARIKSIVDRAMAPTPADRFDSVAELCDALAAAVPVASKRRAWVGAAVIGSIAAIGVGGWFASDRFGPTPEDTEPLAAAAEPSKSAEPPTRAEPAPEPEPKPTAEPSTPVTAPLEPASCGDLDAWMGKWKATAKVTWTEYAFQFDWRVDYEFELALADDCLVNVTARVYAPLVEGELRLPPIETTASAIAMREVDGVWRLPLRLAFPDDSKTYASAESYETVLLFDRVEAAPRLRGAFRKISDEGLWIRLGVLEGQRGVTPDWRAIATDDLACAARCRIDCAGVEAEKLCYERRCAALDHPDDLCGPPSHDFRTPLRVVATRETVRDGEDPFAQALERGGRTKQLLDCAENAKALAGRWGVWLGDSLATLELALADSPDNECQLRGTVSQGERSHEVRGYVTGAGTWVLTPNPEPAPPSWLSHPLVLVGVGERGPAFGSDTAEPPRQLRAFRMAEQVE